MSGISLGQQVHPNVATGTRSESLYVDAGSDQVSLFNGNLSYVIPIGEPIAVGPLLRIAPKLTYNSQIEKKWLVRCDQTPYYEPGNPIATQSGDRIFGAGWQLHFGRLIAAPSGDSYQIRGSCTGARTPPPPGTSTALTGGIGMWNTGFAYQSPDGSVHVFYDRRHEEPYPIANTPPWTGWNCADVAQRTPNAHCYGYTHDGSQLRLDPIDYESGGLPVVYFPDGSRQVMGFAGGRYAAKDDPSFSASVMYSFHAFANEQVQRKLDTGDEMGPWNTTSILDPWGNSIRVAYYGQNVCRVAGSCTPEHPLNVLPAHRRDAIVWSVWDSSLPTSRYVQFTANTNNSFGTPLALVTEISTLSSSGNPDAPDRASWTLDYDPSSNDRGFFRLAHVNMPLNLTLTASYQAPDYSDARERDLLKSITLPTGGRLEWDYGQHFYMTKQSQECSGGCAFVFAQTTGYGVVARRAIRRVVPFGGSATTESAQTLYVRSYDDDPPGCSTAAVAGCEMRVDVWAPAAGTENRTVSRSRFHASDGLSNGSVYGRPMWNKDFRVANDAAPPLDSILNLSPFRTTYFQYEHDPVQVAQDYSGFEHNTRTARTITSWSDGHMLDVHHYSADGASTWDPATGHFLRSVAQETAGGTTKVLREVADTWLPFPTGAPGTWNLGLLSTRTTSRPVGAGDPAWQYLSTTEGFFYDATGFQTSRVLSSNDPNDSRSLTWTMTRGVSSSAPCLKNGAATPTCSNLGFATQKSERLIGSLYGTLVDSTFSRSYYYRYGTLAAAHDTSFYLVDRDVTATGKVVGERSTDGRTSLTDYAPQLTSVTSFDLLGRVISVQPPGEGPETLSWGTRDVLRQKKDLSGNVVEENQAYFDQLGSPTAVRMRMPGGAWSCRVTVLDAAGRRTGQTEWWKNGDPGVGTLCDSPQDVQGAVSALPGQPSTPRGTTWSVFDELDRPTLIRLADGSIVEDTYEGWWSQTTTRTYNVESTSTSSVERDALGQVVAVTEPSAVNANGIAMNPPERTTYSWDHMGRLLRSDKPGSDSTNGSSITQTRTSRYDDFGWLVYRIDPEHPMTVLSRDARGNPTKIMDALIYVTKTYDAAGRLITSSKFGDSPTWTLNGSPSTAYEYYVYDFIGGLGTGRSNGKLISAIRMNHAVTNGGWNDFGWLGILDMFHYGGPGGRLSFRQHGDVQMGYTVSPPPAGSVQALATDAKRRPSQIAFDQYFSSRGRKVRSFTEALALMSPSESAASTRLLADANQPSGMARWQYQYDSAGRLSHVVYPRRDEGYPTEVTYAYSNGFLTGVLAEVRDPFAATTVDTVTGTLGYSPAGSVISTTVHSASGGTNVFTLTTPRDASGISRPGSWTFSALNSTESRPFSYDASGNVRSIGGDTYFYDSRGRLTKDWLAARGTEELREYDGFGNLTRLGGTAISVNRATNRLDFPGTVFNTRGELIYDTTGERSMGRDYYPDGALTAENSHPPSNPFGTPPAISAWLVDYRGDNALTFYGDGEYCHTGFFEASLRDDDQRMLTDYRAEKLSNCDCGANPCTWIEKFQKDYIRIGPWALVTNTRGTGTAFWALDHLGTPRKQTDRLGAVISTMSLDSSGQEIAAVPGERHRFTGHERNHVSVLDGPQFPISDFMHARTYVPMLGRFTRPDPANSFSLFNPQSLNRYSYGLNNPVKFIDPNGLDVVLFNTFPRADYTEVADSVRENLASAGIRYYTVGEYSVADIEREFGNPENDVILVGHEDILTNDFLLDFDVPLGLLHHGFDENVYSATFSVLGCLSACNLGPSERLEHTPGVYFDQFENSLRGVVFAEHLAKLLKNLGSKRIRKAASTAKQLTNTDRRIKRQFRKLSGFVIRKPGRDDAFQNTGFTSADNEVH